MVLGSFGFWTMKNRIISGELLKCLSDQFVSSNPVLKNLFQQSSFNLVSLLLENSFIKNSSLKTGSILLVRMVLALVLCRLVRCINNTEMARGRQVI